MELKHCPFCGEQPDFAENYFYCDQAACRVNPCTEDCGTEDEATKFWNTRTSQWISVDERLPEDGKDYLVCYHEQTEKVFVYIAYKLDGGWVFSSEMDDGSQEVTHWMPLPDPPQTEEE